MTKRYKLGKAVFILIDSVDKDLYVWSLNSEHGVGAYKDELVEMGAVPLPDEPECQHEGDKSNFHPQFCTKCGKEFIYSMWFPNPEPKAAIELPEIDVNDYGHAIIRYSAMEEWMHQVTDTLNKLTKGEK